MKTAISVPDRLFNAADRVSKKLKVSRSRLYSMALDEFLRGSGAMNVREKLDEIYGSEESSLDPVIADLQSRALRKKR